jgi:hypothetical protein
MYVDTFYDQQDLPLEWPVTDEARERAVTVVRHGDYSGDIRLEWKKDGDYFEVNTDFATFNKIALDKDAGEYHEFTNDDGDTVRVHVSDIRDTVANAYRNEAISIIEQLNADEILANSWMVEAGTKRLPV